MFTRSITFGALLLLGACSSSEPGAADASEWTLTFDEVNDMSQLAPVMGDWDIVNAPGAPSAGQALAQTARNDSAVFNVVLIPGVERQDLDLSVAMQSMAGEIDEGGGPLWRAQDANNYYVARFNPLEHNYRVYTVVDGKRTQLASADLPSAPGWHTLRVTMTGDHIRCYYDGELALEVHDSTFPAAGLIGLWTKADAQTQFDDLRVQ